MFGTPRLRPDDAARALRTALDVLERLAGWSAARAEAGSSAIVVGIGLHYGEVFAGVLGDEVMLEHTVLGDTVNVAERLERLTRALPGCLVVS